MDEKKVQNYMNTLVRLSQQHKEMFSAKHHIEVPVCFSEKMCRGWLKLKEFRGKEYDAIDDDGKKYEIKTTTSDKGTTTIKLKQNADYLIWIYFDFENNNIIVRKAEYKYAKAILKKGYKYRKDGRGNISLKNVKNWEVVKKVNMGKLFADISH